MTSIERDATAVSSIDVMMLQTAAALENVASGFYNKASALPCVKQGGAAVAAFVASTAQHHATHARTFNQEAARNGGAVQTAQDPRYARVVADAWPTMTSLTAVVSLGLTLEDAAAQTYIRFAGLAGAVRTRLLFGSIAPVEAQHRAALLAVQALLNQGANALLAAAAGPAKPKPTALPATVGSVGLPAAFYPATDASAVNEGAVR